MNLDFLDALKESWEPTSRPARLGWLAFYALFLLYALTEKSNWLFIDSVFLPIHEGGHLLFRWFGETLYVMGGTILQLGVPLAIAVYFTFRRQASGAAFAAFFFFENFLNVGTYMADARTQSLPLVTVGDSDFVEHDWTTMFEKLGLLQRDTAIGHAVRAIGWLGMFGVVAWFWWRTQQISERPIPNR